MKKITLFVSILLFIGTFAAYPLDLKDDTRPEANRVPRTEIKKETETAATPAPMVKIHFTAQIDKLSILSVSPDNKYLAAGTGDGKLVIVSMDKGIVKYTMQANTKDVFALAWSNDSRYIATGSVEARRTVRIWELSDKLEAINMIGSSALSDFARYLKFTPDSNFLTIGTVDGSVIIWNLKNFKQQQKLRNGLNPILGICFAPDMSYMYTSTTTGGFNRINLGTNKVDFRSIEGGDITNCLALNADGTYLAYACDEAIWMYDSLKGKLEYQIKRAHAGKALSVAFSPDGGNIVTGGRDKQVYIWDSTSGMKVRILSGINGHNAAVTNVAYTTDGKLLVSGSTDGHIVCWKLKD